MLRPALCLVLSLTVLAVAQAGIIVMLNDERDEIKLVQHARDQAEVQEHGKKIEAFAARLRKLKEKDIEALFGKPAPMKAKAFAMPVAQPRGFGMSGMRFAEEKKNKDHEEFYHIGDHG